LTVNAPTIAPKIRLIDAIIPITDATGSITADKVSAMALPKIALMIKENIIVKKIAYNRAGIKAASMAFFTVFAILPPINPAIKCPITGSQTRSKETTTIQKDADKILPSSFFFAISGVNLFEYLNLMVSFLNVEG